MAQRNYSKKLFYKAIYSEVELPTSNPFLNETSKVIKKFYRD